MRFKKGSKVEVLNKGEVPSGSWCCAEIISGNGHTYYVKYDHDSPEIDLAVERVPRKVIRPCPPPMEGSRNWVPGDIVEVFENNSWNPAEVSRVVGCENFFFVRLLGSSREFGAHVSDLRLRQSWKDNKWVEIQKEPEKCNEGKINISTVGKFSRQKCQPFAEGKKGDEQFLNTNDSGFEEPYQTSSRYMKKRPCLWSPKVETYTGAGRKTGAVKKEGKRQRLVAEHSFQLLEKVDAIASPQIVRGEKYMHPSLNCSTTRFPELNMGWGKPNDDVVHFIVGSLELNGSESLSSSVGSCSPSSSPFESSHLVKTSPSHDRDIHFDDAEAPCGSGREPSSPTKTGVATDIHRLELNAYHSTMVALYASGPLSWEQEAIMTNLRLLLHITNDEHLLELRHLATIKSDSA